MNRTITDNDKQSLLNQMIHQILKVKDEVDTKNFNEVYAILKRIDEYYDEIGYTEIHPARYSVVKILEKAKHYL